MITFLWNCRGMIKPNFFLAFKELVDDHKPLIFILTETKVTKEKLPTYLLRLGFNNYDIVEAEGSSGGILVLWNVELRMEVLSLTCQELHLKVKIFNAELPRGQDPTYSQRGESSSKPARGKGKII